MRKRIRLGKGASRSRCSSTRATSAVYSSSISATIATSIILSHNSEQEKQMRRGGADTSGVLRGWDVKSRRGAGEDADGDSSTEGHRSHWNTDPFDFVLFDEGGRVAGSPQFRTMVFVPNVVSQSGSPTTCGGRRWSESTRIEMVDHYPGK
ncbi:hypothetical protein GW17_00061664 [Ensete ventricosum]|nr:hypothetical protein GW17_00061664 [Ensete ventricosum]